MISNPQNTSSLNSTSYEKDLDKDVNDYHLPKNSWTLARNAINNSITGDLGKLGNEPSNLLCIPQPGATDIPFTIIGDIHLIGSFWVIFSTNNINSQIGIFEEDKCIYTKIIEDPCLNFSTYNLIKGVSRGKSTCDFGVYWADGRRNSDRAIDVTIENVQQNLWSNPHSPIPWKQNCIDSLGNTPNMLGYPVGCITCNNTSQLDCDKIRLARLIDPACVTVSKGVSAGTLLNGSYMAVVAYSINGQKVSDWYVSNVQPLFSHDNAAGSLDVNFISLDTRFDQIIVGILSVTNQQTVVRQAGYYSTHQKKTSFDTIQNDWPVIPLSEIPLMSPVADNSDAMYNINDYLLRVGPQDKQDFNYQPLANQIVAKWQSVEYPANYYRKGGNNVQYLRDEIYSFFIRWVYDTGDKSSSYHIPGRPGGQHFTITPPVIPTGYVCDFAPDPTNFLISSDVNNERWRVDNTALLTAYFPSGVQLPDGGSVISEGLMGYWESSEIYPDDKPEIWNSYTNPLNPGFNLSVSPYTSSGWITPTPSTTSCNPYTNSGEAHNLCGKNIRHHKFPDLSLDPTLQYFNGGNNTIRILGVKFENIKAPIDNEGNPIKEIVGYEILRGSRNGNKTILAKGLIANMKRYTVQNASPNISHYFPNYPYNDIRLDGLGNSTDPFLTTTPVLNQGFDPFSGAFSYPMYSNLPAHSRSLFSFHSPDTNFTHPFLSAKELKVHGLFYGQVRGKFEKSEKHPKEKLLTNTALVISAITGIGIAALAMQGNRNVRYSPPKSPGYSQAGLSITGIGDGIYSTEITPDPLAMGQAPKDSDILAIPAKNASLSTLYTGYNGGTINSGLQMLLNIVGIGPTNTINPTWATYLRSLTTTNTAFSSKTSEITQEDSATSVMGALGIATAIPMFFTYFSQATDTMLGFFRAIVRYRDFALRYESHGFYSDYVKYQFGKPDRFSINTSEYLGPQITNFGFNPTTGNEIKINNLYRVNTVAVQLDSDIQDPTTYIDNTLVLASGVSTAETVTGDLTDPSIYSSSPAVLQDPTKAFFTTNTSSYYASLKQNIQNLYGQITGVIEIPASKCIMLAPSFTGKPAVSDVIFGGDTYLGRYTEKNTFFFFYDWLYGQPDGSQLDYTKSEIIPYPRYWANFDQFEISDTLSSMGNMISHLGTPASTGLILPSSYYNLDGLQLLNIGSIGLSGSTSGFSGGGLGNFRLSVKDAWFYLFSSGVRDFYVESEINVDLRDWGVLETEQHYDPYRYTDLKSMFDTNIIKAGNYYKYDQSLSVSKLFLNYTSWGIPQPISYSPFLAETCFIYRPRRLIYSLPAQFEGIKDSWYIFPANDYVDFENKVTCVKSINKSGGLFFFDAGSPMQFLGLDQLQTTSGTKLTIGDGGLFTQPMQSIVNSDSPYEYGSCQNDYSVISTPAGVFWVSQNQGKIFSFQGGLVELSMQDLKWWFSTYLPYKLTSQFPSFQLTNNPVVGIGCQGAYDNDNSLVYFTKKDFALKSEWIGLVTYFQDNIFRYLGNDILLGDPQYFEDVSWTISYDPKSKGWLSYHDWHPELIIPGKNTFLTTKTNALGQGTIYSHNIRCDSYCNYYGINYPFEIEFMINTMLQVNTVKSIEYILEVYKYDNNCYDRFHILDANFDSAVVYNTEQVSGLLNLNLDLKNDPQGSLYYPHINFNSIDIVFDKVEQKYRFNQFWDITADRGQNNPNAQRMIWNTHGNGYAKNLNFANLNYTKEEFQRKKFRHYTNTVWLRKNAALPGTELNQKMLVLVTNNKDLNSPR